MFRKELSLQDMRVLVRISCHRCGFEPVWTDEPETFLESVCPAPENCEATVTPDKAKPATDEQDDQEWQIP